MLRTPNVTTLGITGLALAVGATAQADAAPVGIYSLSVARDNPNTPADERLANIRDYDFVSGYTLRVFWSDLETSQGTYDFRVIEEAIRRTRAVGQRLNLEVLPALPSYVVSGASATYVDHRNVTTPVPRDPFAQSRFTALHAALASYVVDDGANAPHPLNQDPTLVAVDATPVGLNYGVRDLNNGIRNHPDYTQARYVDAVTQGVAASRSNFPNHEGFLAFFGFTDGQPGAPVDQQIIQQLAAQYNGPQQPSLAFFIENLSDTGPAPIGMTGGTGNNLLDWTESGGTTMMQALDSWLQHSPDRDPTL